MDFDEYEYLEKTVENPDAPKAAAANGNGAAVAEEERKDRSRSSKHGAEDEAHRDSGHRRSKRSRADDEDREHERGSSRQRDRSGDGERDRHRSSRERDREREERNGREKDRERERTRDREERERSRRSQSRSERRLEEENHRRQQERSREKEREKERERELKERDFRERERESRRHRDKKEEAAEPEADPERDQRTVFAYQIGLKADERDVYEFFSRAGKVRDVRLIMDRNSRRSKGVGYIEFYDAMAVPMAIALSGQPLLGQPVMVKPSEAEKNLVQSTSTSGAASGVVGPYSGGARRLYVGNLPYNITEEQLRQVFEPFGTVELVQLPIDPETGHGKGYGFVQFARLEDARAAQSLNGQLPIAGKTIKVSAITDQTGEQDIGANTGDFDDDEGGGLSLNAHSRALLMQKLDRSGTATSVTGAITTPAVNVPALAVPTASVLGVPPVVAPILQPPVAPLLSLTGSGLPGVPAVPVETSGIPCECLLLKNMFDPNVETEPDFDLDIKEDVREECSKFGSVKHIFVEKNSAGYVYLRFDSANSAVNAQRALHGRWFAGKMITATFMLPQQYEAKFPSSS